MYSFLKTIDVTELDEYQKRKYDWLTNNDYGEATIITYWSQLNKIHELELIKNKDLYEFDKQDIINIVKNIATTAIQTKRVYWSLIKRYIDWTVEIGLNYVGNPCDQIDTNDILNINSVALENQYIELNYFYNSIIAFDCSDIDRMLLILLRYGVPINQAMDVKWEDVDRDDMVLNIINKKSELLRLPIDSLFLMFVDKAKICSCYNGKKFYEYIDEGYIIKKHTKEKGSNLYTKLNRIAKNNGLRNISTQSLNDSRIYDLISEKIDKNTMTIKREDIKHVVNRLYGTHCPAKITTFSKRINSIFKVKVI